MPFSYDLSTDKVELLNIIQVIQLPGLMQFSNILKQTKISKERTSDVLGETYDAILDYHNYKNSHLVAFYHTLFKAKA